jgi:hypothetical protein
MTTSISPYELELYELAYPDKDGFGGRHEAGFLDQELSAEPVIVVKQTFTCHCYQSPKQANYYVVRGGPLTYRYVTQELARQGMKLECSHSFFEGFDQITDVQFELFCGS